MVMADMSIDALGEVRLNDPIHSSTPKRKAVEGVFDMEDEVYSRNSRYIDIVIVIVFFLNKTATPPPSLMCNC